MGFSINTAMIGGNVGNDPELTYSGAGRAILKFNVATNVRYKNNDGAWTEITDWHRITVFGGTAESLARNVVKGSKVAVSGRISHSSWETADGEKRHSIEIIADDVVIISDPAKQSASLPCEECTSPAPASAPVEAIDDSIPF